MYGTMSGPVPVPSLSTIPYLSGHLKLVGLKRCTGTRMLRCMVVVVPRYLGTAVLVRGGGVCTKFRSKLSEWGLFGLGTAVRIPLH